ncbi:unnamed protein product [Polarella glacialis]|uniref:Uncharacterized protein n=1 Tax=Polarella glacialis TaxID=89957 RepID=A0A813DDF4_POLGL|nr:unnamed protein product [Polarella glacialis]
MTTDLTHLSLAGLSLGSNNNNHNNDHSNNNNNKHHHRQQALNAPKHSAASCRYCDHQQLASKSRQPCVSIAFSSRKHRSLWPRPSRFVVWSGNRHLLFFQQRLVPAENVLIEILRPLKFWQPGQTESLNNNCPQQHHPEARQAPKHSSMSSAR